jgi:UDP-2-acetamido-3-amino-2,3-dideoxy-glucuronate N-acetyltransferase
MDDATIGAEAMLGQGCFVGRGVAIGERARIQNNVSVFEGVSIEEDVFIGPSVVFSNVKRPRAFSRRGSRADTGARKREFERTVVRRGATVGANATILPGIELGAYCFVGAGALVSRSVPDHALVVGVPARRVGWVARSGVRLRFVRNVARCPLTGERYRLTRSGVRCEG